MPSSRNNLYKITLWAIGIIVLIAGISAFVVPPAVFPDPSWGFMVMRSMQMGGGFNLINSPDPLDISKNFGTFLSWWSPGQYLVPYFFKSILSLNTGQASAMTVTVCSFTGLTGFFFFFKKIGFTNAVSTVSLVFILCQQAFWMPFAFYNGGEILLFAFEGWFLYGCMSFEKADFKLAIFVLLSGWLGFFCKSSFMWIYAAGLLCIWIRLCINQNNVFIWIKKGLWLAIPAAISLITIYFFYLSRGENPTTDSNGYKLAWETFAFPMASPLLSGFSVDDITHGLLFHSGPAMFSPDKTLIILFLLVIASLFLIAAIVIFVPNKPYKLFVLVFYGLSVVFFGYSFLRQTNISYESRHFRTIGLLVVPGVIYLVGLLRLPWKVLFILLCMWIARKSEKFISGMHEGNREDAHGISGISQPFIDQPILNQLMALDRQNKNAIFVFLSADFSLDLTGNRTIILEDVESSYTGHAGPIYMLLPASYTPQKAAVWFKCFPGYKDFSVMSGSKKCVLYFAK